MRTCKHPECSTELSDNSPLFCPEHNELNQPSYTLDDIHNIIAKKHGFPDYEAAKRTNSVFLMWEDIANTWAMVKYNQEHPAAATPTDTFGLLSVGITKNEFSFSIISTIGGLSYDDLKEFRSTIIEAICTVEDMWKKAQAERRVKEMSSDTPNTYTKI